MRRGLPWLIAAFVLVTAVVHASTGRDDDGASIVIKIHRSQDRVVLALAQPSQRAHSPERIVLSVLAVQKRPDAPTTLPAADEQALFGIDTPARELKPQPVVAMMPAAPEASVVEYKPRKRMKPVSPRLQRERCGRACNETRYASARDRIKLRKRGGSQVTKSKIVTPEDPEVIAATASTPKQVNVSVPGEARGAPALIEMDEPAATSGGIRLNGSTSLTVRHLSTVLPSANRDNDAANRSAFSDDREDPSRNGAAVGLSFKLN